MEDQFVFNQADGKAKGCRLDLWKDDKDSLYTTKPDEDCAAQFEFVSGIAGWDLAGDAGISLVGTEGRSSSRCTRPTPSRRSTRV